jgi:pimeloyl-ACP methyl ester carboxylesterase
MKPLFFGESQKQLFGVYHPTANERASRGLAVLLCYPGIQEYNMTHWAFRKLGTSLARQGFPSLRFDYFATGDSMGATGDGGPDEWVRNIATAAQELKDLSGARAISVVGMRLGAALAARACAEGLAVKDLVYWDPVVRGKEYLRELRTLDAQQRLIRLVPEPVRGSPQPEQLLGVSFPRQLEREIEKIDMLSFRTSDVDKVTVVASDERPVYREFCNVLRASGNNVALTVAVDEGATVTAATGQAALLWSKPLVAIADAISAAPGP